MVNEVKGKSVRGVKGTTKKGSETQPNKGTMDKGEIDVVMGGAKR